jgi:uncharacterized protein
MRALLVLAVVLALSGGQSAGAEPKAAAAPDMAVKEALVRRYFKAMEFEKLMDSMVSSMTPVMAEQAAKSNPALTAEQRQIISDVVRDAMHDVMTPKLIEMNVSVYAEAFSEAELRALVVFYESPEGRSIMQKTPALMPKAAAIARELMPQMEREVMTRVCARVDCNALQPPKTRPS